jgi:hypothetical protein
MTTSQERKPSRERYQFTWSTSTAQSVRSVAETVSTINPEGYMPEPTAFRQPEDLMAEEQEVFEEPDIEVAEVVQPVEPQVVDLSAVEVQRSAAEKYPPIDEGSMYTFRSASKAGLKSFTGLKLSASQLRIAGLAGWSIVAGGGAIALLVGPGPILGLRLGAIGGVWAAVSALVWFLPGKLTK